MYMIIFCFGHVFEQCVLEIVFGSFCCSHLICFMFGLFVESKLSLFVEQRFETHVEQILFVFGRKFDLPFLENDFKMGFRFVFICLFHNKTIFNLVCETNIKTKLDRSAQRVPVDLPCLHLEALAAVQFFACLLSHRRISPLLACSRNGVLF